MHKRMYVDDLTLMYNAPPIAPLLKDTLYDGLPLAALMTTLKSVVLSFYLFAQLCDTDGPRSPLFVLYSLHAIHGQLYQVIHRQPNPVHVYVKEIG